MNGVINIDERNIGNIEQCDEAYKHFGKRRFEK